MLDFIQQIAQEAGAMALAYRARLHAVAVDYKSVRDLVTEADREIELYLRKRIADRYPGHGILGEEFGAKQGDAYRWVIDPIDGTGSFVHGQPTFSVSIGVQHHGVGVLGAVAAPALGELFLAEQGAGAWCNGAKISCSTATELNRCILATGFACLRDGAAHNNLPYLHAILPQLQDMRRYGSAAMDLAFVAAGRVDGFWELNLHEYDIAAGVVLVREAGGVVSDFHGRTDDLPHRVLACNAELHAKIVSQFAKLEDAQDAALAE
ncbi:MAG TPA: inositol monophosphatase [Lentisphaeria bacterium]|nr:inositol monophosphatase [Lentisphaeria bacterium]